MTICKSCSCEFPRYATINGKRVSLYARKYCLSCSPYGEYKKNGNSGWNKKPVIDGKKQCATCKLWKPLNEYRPRNRKNDPDGKRCSFCDVCEEKRQRGIVRIRNESRNAFKKQAVNYLGGKCMICGYDRCLACLHFHHKNPTQKDFSIGNKRNLFSWETVKLELDKCLLLCANCHGELHWG